LLVLCTIALAGCGHRAETAAQPAPPPVALTTIAAGSVSPTRRLGGTAAPLQNVGVSSTLTEPASAVFVREGQAVHRGEILARLDVADLQAQLDADLRSADEADANVSKQRFQSAQTIVQGVGSADQASAALAQSRQKLRLDQLTLQRDEALLAQTFIARQTVDEQRETVTSDEQQVVSATAVLASAHATVTTNGTNSSGLQGASIAAAAAAAAMARSQAAQVVAQIARATLRSPIDGVVVNRNLNPGEYPGTRTLFSIQESGDAYALLNASSDEVQGIRAGDRAVVVATGTGAASVSGYVEAVLAQVEPGSTNFAVKVRLPNASGTLLAGMAVGGTIALGRTSGLRVPRSVFTDGGESSVIAVVNGRTRVAGVTKVAEDEQFAIVRGLAAGQRVITNGNAGYSNGQSVAVR
jgi:multidrug efflux pump subunit AcrA (membrane-fusion protein)